MEKKEDIEESGWKGWKNEIKDIVKQSNKKIELEELQVKVIKRYREFGN